MKKTFYNCVFLKPLKINAIVLYPFVLYCDKEPSADIKRHEAVHLAQIKRLGAVRFYLQYLKEYLTGRLAGKSHYQSYRDISYEKEAFED